MKRQGLLRKYIKPHHKGFIEICSGDRTTLPVWFTLPHFLLTTVRKAKRISRIESTESGALEIRGIRRGVVKRDCFIIMDAVREFSLVSDLIRCECQANPILHCHSLTSNWTAGGFMLLSLLFEGGRHSFRMIRDKQEWKNKETSDYPRE